MRRAWLPPVAALATGLLIWSVGRAPAAAAAVPLVLPGLWTAVWLLTGRPPLVVAMAIWGVLGGAFGLPLVPAAILGMYVAAGLAGGAAVERNRAWLDAAAIAAAVMLPAVALSALQAPVVTEFARYADDLRAAFAERLPAGMAPAEREAAAAEFSRQLDALLDVSRWIWPALLALGQLALAGLGLALGASLARLGGWRGAAIPRRPFRAWEAPGAVVWVLAAALALVVAGRGPARIAGVNVAILAGLALSAQGLAVQAWLTGRWLPPAGRAAFWLLAACFLAPLAVVGMFIGLLDQWWDLRSLRRGPAQQGEGGSPWK